LFWFIATLLGTGLFVMLHRDFFKLADWTQTAALRLLESARFRLFYAVIAVLFVLGSALTSAGDNHRSKKGIGRSVGGCASASDEVNRI